MEPCACLTTTGSADASCFCLRSANGAPWPQLLRVPRASGEGEARPRRGGAEERRAPLPPNAHLSPAQPASLPHALLLTAAALSGFIGWKLGRAAAAPPPVRPSPPAGARRRLQPLAPSSASPGPPSGSPVDASTVANVLEQAAADSAREIRAAAAAQALEERAAVAASVRKERLQREGSPGVDTAFPLPIYPSASLPPTGLPPTGLPPSGLPPVTPARNRNAAAPAEDNSFRAWEPEAWEAAGFGPTGTPLPPHLVRTPAKAPAAGDAPPPTTGRRQRAIRD